MRRLCEISYRPYDVDLAPVFNGGGVTYDKCRIYGDPPSVPITGATGPITMTLWMEEGSGDVDATPDQRQFFQTLNWVREE